MSDDEAHDVMDDLSAFYGIALDNTIEEEDEVDQAEDVHGEFGNLYSNSKLDLDSINFDVQSYIRDAMKQPLDSLLQQVNTIQQEKNALDMRMQTLVYENYNKFISATDIIRSMNKTFVSMEDEMLVLQRTMTKIQDFSSSLHDKFQPNLEKVSHLTSLSTLIEKLNFVFRLPAIVRSHIRRKEYRRALHAYTSVSPLLRRHHPVSSFAHIITRTEERIAEMAKVVEKEVDIAALLRGPTSPAVTAAGAGGDEDEEAEPPSLPYLLDHLVLLVELGRDCTPTLRALFSRLKHTLLALLRTAVAQHRDTVANAVVKVPVAAASLAMAGASTGATASTSAAGASKDRERDKVEVASPHNPFASPTKQNTLASPLSSPLASPLKAQRTSTHTPTGVWTAHLPSLASATVAQDTYTSLVDSVLSTVYGDDSAGSRTVSTALFREAVVDTRMLLPRAWLRVGEDAADHGDEQEEAEDEDVYRKRKNITTSSASAEDGEMLDCPCLPSLASVFADEGVWQLLFNVYWKPLLTLVHNMHVLLVQPLHRAADKARNTAQEKTFGKVSSSPNSESGLRLCDAPHLEEMHRLAVSLMDSFITEMTTQFVEYTAPICFQELGLPCPPVTAASARMGVVPGLGLSASNSGSGALGSAGPPWSTMLSLLTHYHLQLFAEYVTAADTHATEAETDAAGDRADSAPNAAVLAQSALAALDIPTFISMPQLPPQHATLVHALLSLPVARTDKFAALLLGWFEAQAASVILRVKAPIAELALYSSAAPAVAAVASFTTPSSSTSFSGASEEVSYLVPLSHTPSSPLFTCDLPLVSPRLTSLVNMYLCGLAKQAAETVGVVARWCLQRVCEVMHTSLCFARTNTTPFAEPPAKAPADATLLLPTPGTAALAAAAAHTKSGLSWTGYQWYLLARPTQAFSDVELGMSLSGVGALARAARGRMEPAADAFTARARTSSVYANSAAAAGGSSGAAAAAVAVVEDVHPEHVASQFATVITAGLAATAPFWKLLGCSTYKDLFVLKDGADYTGISGTGSGIMGMGSSVVAPPSGSRASRVSFSRARSSSTASNLSTTSSDIGTGTSAQRSSTGARVSTSELSMLMSSAAHDSLFLYLYHLYNCLLGSSTPQKYIPSLLPSSSSSSTSRTRARTVTQGIAALFPSADKPLILQHDATLVTHLAGAVLALTKRMHATLPFLSPHAITSLTGALAPTLSTDNALAPAPATLLGSSLLPPRTPLSPLLTETALLHARLRTPLSSISTLTHHTHPAYHLLLAQAASYFTLHALPNITDGAGRAFGIVFSMATIKALSSAAESSFANAASVTVNLGYTSVPTPSPLYANPSRMLSSAASLLSSPSANSASGHAHGGAGAGAGAVLGEAMPSSLLVSVNDDAIYSCRMPSRPIASTHSLSSSSSLPSSSSLFGVPPSANSSSSVATSSLGLRVQALSPLLLLWAQLPAHLTSLFLTAMEHHFMLVEQFRNTGVAGISMKQISGHALFRKSTKSGVDFTATLRALDRSAAPATHTRGQRGSATQVPAQSSNPFEDDDSSTTTTASAIAKTAKTAPTAVAAGGGASNPFDDADAEPAGGADNPFADNDDDTSDNTTNEASNPFDDDTPSPSSPATSSTTTSTPSTSSPTSPTALVDEYARLPFLPLKHTPLAPSPTTTYTLQLLLWAQTLLTDIVHPDTRVQTQQERWAGNEQRRVALRGAWADVCAHCLNARTIMNTHANTKPTSSADHAATDMFAGTDLLTTEAALLSQLGSDAVHLLQAVTDVCRPCGVDRTCIMFMLVKLALKAMMERLRRQRLDRYDLQQVQVDVAAMQRVLPCLLPGSEPDSEVMLMCDEVLHVAAQRYCNATDFAVFTAQEEIKREWRTEKTKQAKEQRKKSVDEEKLDGQDITVDLAGGKTSASLPDLYSSLVKAIPVALLQESTYTAIDADAAKLSERDLSDICEEGPFIDYQEFCNSL